jgi:hypothetical protein
MNESSQGAAPTEPRPEPQASVGRVVLFTPSGGTTRKGQKYPATITHCFGGDCVNLSVGQDGSFPLTPGELTPTSVMKKTRDDQTYVWEWPARV